jgi:TetR/AcrR family transcriptional regulator, cholesterol catabolism regulator
MWLDLLNEGVAGGALRRDLDAELVFRFIRDTVWVAVRWYRPGGSLSAREVADQYLSILLDGIAARRRPVRGRP